MRKIIAALAWIEAEAAQLGISEELIAKAIAIAWSDLHAGKAKELILDELKLLFGNTQI